MNTQTQNKRGLYVLFYFALGAIRTRDLSLKMLITTFFKFDLFVQNPYY